MNSLLPPDARTASAQAAEALKGMDLSDHLASPAIKQRYVTTMFDIIAPSYDRFTRAFSFGMDQSWKRELIAAVLASEPPAGLRAADLACGTGDLARGLADRLVDAEIDGIDASPVMIAAANAILAERARRLAQVPGIGLVRQGRLHVQVGDMMALPFADASLDLVTIGYGLRNVPDHRQALREIARVLRPGGRLFNLDFCLPEAGWWRRLYLGYLTVAGRCFGLLWHGQPDVYGYIARSIAGFVTARQLSRDLEACGLVVERMSPKLLGGMSLHVARRS